MATQVAPAESVAMYRFSTEAFPKRERLAAWREIFGRTVVSLDIEPSNPERFQAEATVWRLPGLGVLRASSDAAHLAHSRQLIVDDDLSFMLGSNGTLLIAGAIAICGVAPHRSV